MPLTHSIISNGCDTQECVRAAGQTGCVRHAWFARANDSAHHLDRAILIRDYYRFVVVRDNIIIVPCAATRFLRTQAERRWRKSRASICRMYISPPIIFRRVTARMRYNGRLLLQLSFTIDLFLAALLAKLNGDRYQERMSPTCRRIYTGAHLSVHIMGMWGEEEEVCMLRIAIVYIGLCFRCWFLLLVTFLGTKCFSYLLRDRRSRVNGKENTYSHRVHAAGILQIAAFIAFQSLLVLIENPFASQIFVSILSSSFLAVLMTWYSPWFLDVPFKLSDDIKLSDQREAFVSDVARLLNSGSSNLSGRVPWM